MSKFMGTAGPWVAVNGLTSGREVVGRKPRGGDYVVARCGGKDREANACLISAAPELLEALEGIMRVEARDRVMPVGAEWDAARAAIAKALGNQ